MTPDPVPALAAFEAVPFDVTIRVSDTAIRKDYHVMLSHVREMVVDQVAEQVGVAPHLIDYDQLTVVQTPMQSMREVHFRAQGTWLRQGEVTPVTPQSYAVSAGKMSLNPESLGIVADDDERAISSLMAWRASATRADKLRVWLALGGSEEEFNAEHPA